MITSLKGWEQDVDVPADALAAQHSSCQKVEKRADVLAA
jgi:hypothetical protein